MKRTTGLIALLLLLGASGAAQAQDAKPAEHHSIAQVLDHSVAGVEGEFVPAAEAMPEDKYSFAPTSGEFKGVRTSLSRPSTWRRSTTWWVHPSWKKNRLWNWAANGRMQ